MLDLAFAKELAYRPAAIAPENLVQVGRVHATFDRDPGQRLRLAGMLSDQFLNASKPRGTPGDAGGLTLAPDVAQHSPETSFDNQGRGQVREAELVV